MKPEAQDPRAQDKYNSSIPCNVGAMSCLILIMITCVHRPSVWPKNIFLVSKMDIRSILCLCEAL